MNRSRDESTSSSGNVSVASTGGSRQKKSRNAQSKPPNPVTVEKVRMIMEQEGRSARNLVSWSIPLDNNNIHTKGKQGKSNRTRNQGKRAQSCESVVRKVGHDSKESYNTTRSSSGERKGKKVASENLGRRTGKKPVSIRARYWAYLFENLRRAVDEIYTTCDADANVMECKEVLLVLDNYRHEFQALIDWINLQERLENSDIHDRPTSLAWEVRKSSPGRPRQKAVPKVPDVAPQLSTTDLKINRLLNFSKAPDAASLLTASLGLASAVTNKLGQTAIAEHPQTVTWADRVKGIAKPENKSPVISPGAENRCSVVSAPQVINSKPTDDDDGWETVPSRPRQSKHQRSQKQDVKVLQNISNTTMHVKHNASLPDIPTSTKPSNDSPKPNAEIPKTSQDQDRAKTSQLVNAKNVDVRTPVEFASGYHGVAHADSSKLLFEGDARESVNDDVDLQELDEAEVEFFKSVQQEDNQLDKNERIPAETTSSQLEKGDSVAMEQLRALKQHDESIAAAEEEERDLRRQILEVQEEKNDDNDTPDLETDSESARSSMGAKELTHIDRSTNGPLEWSEFLARFDNPGNQNWCELVEEEEQVREPGRAGEMHEKLSSPSRKSARNSAESKRKLEEKHRRAEERRLQMQEERANRVHELFEKVQEVVAVKNDLIQRQKVLLQSYHLEKLAKAEEQRAMQLLTIKRKAQAEDTKVNEIAFINELQEQNKRHEVMMRLGELEARIQEKEVEKLKVLEMKSAKEEIVKERRRALEKERRDRIEELKVKRAEQDARIEQQRMEKEKEREKVAKERARERELRLSARNAAQQEAVSELQKKIQLKHDESERRHQEQLEQRKEKALELSLGRFTTASPATVQGASGDGVDGAANSSDEKVVEKLNTDLKLDYSEHSTAARGSANNSPRSANDDKALKEEMARLTERKRTMKRRAKKIRVRMATRGKEFIKKIELKNQTPNGASKSKIVRLIKDANRQLTNQNDSTGPWPPGRVTALDRSLGEIVRVLEKVNTAERAAFRLGGGFDILDAIFQLPLREDASQDHLPVLPDRLLSNAALCFQMACAGCQDNCVFAVYSNKVMTLVDALLQLICRNSIDELAKSNPALPPKDKAKKSPGSAPSIQFDAASPSFLKALAVILSMLANNPPSAEASSPKAAAPTFVQLLSQPNNEHRKILEVYLNRGLDVISYIVATGVLDVLGQYLSNVRHQVAPGSNLAAFVRNGLAFLEAATSFMTMRNRLSPNSHSQKQVANPDLKNPSAIQWDTDPTQLLPTLQHTELMGIVSVLYGLLLHGAPERPTTLDEDQVTLAPSEQIADHTLSVALAVMRVLNAVAEMDLRLLQASLGAEGVSLEYRHICTYLLWYCVQCDYAQLLHEVIVAVGHFTLDSRSNQDIVVSGAQPTVLQQLCLLPFSYFSNPALARVLFPTVISCCFDNRSNVAVLEQEASASWLVTYIESFFAEAKDNEGRVAAARKANGTIRDVSSCSLHDHPLFSTDYLTEALAFFSADEEL